MAGDVAVRDAELVVLVDAEVGPDLRQIVLVEAGPELVQLEPDSV